MKYKLEQPLSEAIRDMQVELEERQEATDEFN